MSTGSLGSKRRGWSVTPVVYAGRNHSLRSLRSPGSNGEGLVALLTSNTSGSQASSPRWSSRWAYHRTGSPKGFSLRRISS